MGIGLKGLVLAGAASLAFGGTGMAADAITVVSWGGAYTASQVEAYHKPFTAETGIAINSEDYNGGLAQVRAQVEANNVTWDVVDVEMSDAVRGCDEGLLEPIDASMLPPAPDGTPAGKDFIEGAIMECAVANIVWSTIYAYDKGKFAGDRPDTMADFFDTAKFPGKRGMRKSPKANLEMALIADGVPPGEVYKVLGSESGIDRAFAKLDSIKDSVVWWEAGAQPPQMLADGEVVMTTAYNGRIFNAQVKENRDFAIVWDGQIFDMDLFVVPKGARNKEEAMRFVAFATGTRPLADQAKYISYGPARKSSAPFVSTYSGTDIDMKPHMPTAPENFMTALQNDFEWWADHQDEMNEKFNAWLAR